MNGFNRGTIETPHVSTDPNVFGSPAISPKTANEVTTLGIIAAINPLSSDGPQYIEYCANAIEYDELFEKVNNTANG
jgi:hypothetical protein